MNDNEAKVIADAVTNLSKHQSLKQLNDFLQQYDLQNPDLELGQTEYDELRLKINDFKETIYSLQLGPINPLTVVLESLISAYTLFHNQVEIINEELTAESEEFRKELNDRDNQANNENGNGNDNEADDLRNQLAQMKLALNNQGNQVDIAKDEGKSETIYAIASKFDLTSRDLDQLISGLAQKINEPEGVIANVVQTFDLPPETNSIDIVYALREKFNNQTNSNITEQLRDELLKKTEEIESLREQLSKNESTNNYSSNKNDENNKITTRSVTIDDDSNDKNDKNDNNNNKNDNKNNRNEEEKEKEKLKQKINELNEKIGELPNEKQILAAFEEPPLLNTDEITTIIHSELPLINKIRKIISTISLHVYSNEELQETNRTLLSIVSAQYKFIKSLSDSEKVCTAVYSDHPYEDLRQTLLSQTESVSLFLQEHATGIVEDSCLFEELLKHDGTPELLDNVQRYLQEYTKPSTHESEHLFILLLQAISAADVLRKYSSQSQMLCHQQAKDIKQMKAYNDQLEKSLDTMNTSPPIVTERSITLDEHSNNNSKSPSKQINKNSSTPHNNTQNNKLNTNTNNNNKSNDKNNTNDLNDGNNGNNSEFVKNLQKQLTQTRNENIELKKSKEQLVKQTHEDLLKVQEEIDRMKESMNRRLAQKNRDIQKLSASLKKSTDRVKEVRSQNDKLRESLNNNSSSLSRSVDLHENGPTAQSNAKNSSSSSKNNKNNSENNSCNSNNNNSNNSNNKDNMGNNNKNINSPNTNNNNNNNNDSASKSLIENIQEQIEGTKKDYEKVIAQMKDEIQNYQNTKQSEFDAAVTEKDKQIKSLTEKCDESLRNSKKLAKRNYRIQQQLNSLEEQISSLTKSENEALSQAEQLGAKFREIHEDYLKLEHENVMLNQKLEANGDAAKREKQLLKSQFDRQMNEQQSLFQTSINRVKEDGDSLNKKLLIDIAHIFPSYVDLNKPVNKDSIIEALQKVKKACSSDVKLKEKTAILKQVKKDLSCEHDIQIPGAILTLINKYNQLETETQPIINGMDIYLQTQEWLQRMYVLCTGGMCQDVTNIEMQHIIEEALVSSFGSLLLSRRVAMLRAEKRLLLSDCLKMEQKNQRLSIRHILILVMLVLKTKRLSGHKEGTGYSFENAERPEDIMNPKSKKQLSFAEKAPLSNFIYDIE